MEYLIVKDVLLFVFTCCCIGISIYSSLRLSKEVRNEARENRESLTGLLKHSIDTLKSASLEERVNATALEGQHEVQLEMLKDAYEVEKSDGGNSYQDPRYAHSDNGTRIDLNDYEIL